MSACARVCAGRKRARVLFRGWRRGNKGEGVVRVWGAVADQNILRGVKLESIWICRPRLTAARWRRDALPNAAGYNGVLCV